ncbi:MAG: sensor domain-containing diguanylate cyclase [Gammaproteobacteria bacterium]|nr:sensor domain-containing diguanylate cyclase [Gammaproteobacteria bacterium]MDH3429314.1 sensor domain-containing diguanylate cyclase [Gammaproteobacteria bacterium]MDH3432588.1 sensor domain-containing diguanylate cyclase [Gammaproteobacteria bacterium]
MQTADDLTARLEAAERQLEELTAAVAHNDEKMRRTQQRELRLLQAEDLETLLHELLDGLRVSYGLEQVSIVFCDPDHDVRHLLLAAGTPAESFHGLLMVESLTGLAPQYVALRKPWLGLFAACDHQLMFPQSSGLGSVAMIPLTRRKELIGSINLGSADPGRFTREHAADFLAHLGVIASYCVDNTVNRARLLRSGFTDVLTGWHNRRYLLVRLNEELARARRDGSHLVCLMLDVDHFKRVNDSWGHAAGDAVLRELANRIDTQVRASDVAARYGGEEFVVLLPDTDKASGILLAERIRRAISVTEYRLPNGQSVAITASIGIAGTTPEPDTEDLKTAGDSLIARADVALYRAKSNGRDQIAVDEH